MLRFDELNAMGIKKGSKIRFTNCRNGQTMEGTVTKKATRTKRGGKYFCGARNRWIDAEPVKKMELTIQTDGLILLEDTFYTMEVN